MALSRVSTGQNYDNGGSTWVSTTLTVDSGTASGDFILIGIVWYANGADPVANPSNAPTGQGTFTQRITRQVVSGSGGTGTFLDLYTKVADGTESGSYTVARANSQNWYAHTFLLTLRGSSSLSWVSVSSANTGSSVTTIDAPSVSGTAGQGLLCLYTVSDPAGTYTPPSGMTLGIGLTTENTNSGRIYYKDLSSTGATGAQTLSWTTSRSTTAQSILIDGAGAGGGGGQAPRTMHHFRQLLGA